MLQKPERVGVPVETVSGKKKGKRRCYRFNCLISPLLLECVLFFVRYKIMYVIIITIQLSFVSVGTSMSANLVKCFVFRPRKSVQINVWLCRFSVFIIIKLIGVFILCQNNCSIMNGLYKLDNCRPHSADSLQVINIRR